jgi:hypothetical protein
MTQKYENFKKRSKIKMNFIVKWTNKFSNETGYVMKVNKKMGYFENTFDKASAFAYKTKASAKSAITWLMKSAEGENNTFDIEEVAL